MKEMNKPETISAQNGNLVDPFASAAELVQVSHGQYRLNVNGAGLTIAELRDSLTTRLNLPEDGVEAVVDGRPVDEQHKLRPGQRLHWVRARGEKGVVAVAK